MSAAPPEFPGGLPVLFFYEDPEEKRQRIAGAQPPQSPVSLPRLDEPGQPPLDYPLVPFPWEPWGSALQTQSGAQAYAAWLTGIAQDRLAAVLPLLARAGAPAVGLREDPARLAELGRWLQRAFPAVAAPSMRAAALSDLGRVAGNDAEVEAILVNRLEHDPGLGVRRAAARCLRHLAGQPHVRAVLQAAAAADEDVEVRWERGTPCGSPRRPDLAGAASRAVSFRISRRATEGDRVSELRQDQHRTALGFLTVAETDALADSGVRVLDPFSTLISAGVVIGPDTVIYPGVVIQKDAASRLELGARNVLYPGTILLAEQGGSLVIGDECELGPGGVQVKANQAGADIRVGHGARLLNGCELTGQSELGDGCQIIGTVQAQSVRLAGGLGGYRWPEPEERGALLKGTGLARGIVLERGEVISCQPSFADAEVARQSSFHPPHRPASGRA